MLGSLESLCPEFVLCLCLSLPLPPFSRILCLPWFVPLSVCRCLSSVASLCPAISVNDCLSLFVVMCPSCYACRCLSIAGTFVGLGTNMPHTLASHLFGTLAHVFVNYEILVFVRGLVGFAGGASEAFLGFWDPSHIICGVALSSSRGPTGGFCSYFAAMFLLFIFATI